MLQSTPNSSVSSVPTGVTMMGVTGVGVTRERLSVPKNTVDRQVGVVSRASENTETVFAPLCTYSYHIIIFSLIQETERQILIKEIAAI